MAPAIFLAPNPDSVAHTLAPGITEHIRAGRDVLVRLVADGGASSVRTSYGYPSRSVFVRERVEEFARAVDALGATVLDWSATVGNPDGIADENTLSAATAKAFCQQLISRFPGASIKATSDKTTAGGSDARNLGIGLRQTGYADARYYVHPNAHGSVAGTFTSYYDLSACAFASAPICWLSESVLLKRVANQSTRGKVHT